MKKTILAIVSFLCLGGAAAQGVEFGGDFRAAVERAGKSGKPLMVVLLARGNDLSQQMTDNVFTDPELGKLYNAEFVPVALWDDTVMARAMYAAYGFPYYPALLFLSPEGDFLRKEAGYKDVGDMLDIGRNYKHPKADRLAWLRRAFDSGSIGRDALREYVELSSELGLKNNAVLERWLAEAPADAATFALITSQDPAVGSAPFKFLVDNAARFAAATDGNEVETYIYNKYFDLLRAEQDGRKDVLNGLKNEGYKYADALVEHLALAHSVDGAAGNAATRADIDRLTAKYPVAGVHIGGRLMRKVGQADPAFEKYVAEFAERLSAWSPQVAVAMARYIANNYLIVHHDVLAADPWVDRYLRWSGDPNCEPDITRTVKQAIGEWPCDDYGREMPDMVLKTSDGKSMRVSDLRGGFVLIDFWASWCGPCKAEIPHVKEAYEMVKGAPVRFVSISSDKDDAAWLRAVNEIDVPWLNLSSNGTDMLKQYKVSGIPRIMVLDPDGRLVADNITGQTIEVQLRRMAGKYGWDWK